MSHAPDITAGRLPPEVLERNFADLHPRLGAREAKVAAERCLFCFDAPCVQACPTSIDIPLFIRQIATGNPMGAARTILDANIMGGMCARVCPTETLCEEVCVREVSEGKPVEIGRLQRFATDTLFASGRQLYRQGPATGHKIAVVGAGPAGLACAHKLATLGHSVVLLEAREKAGGLNEYGIAAYKTTGGFAQEEVDYILGVGGIELRTGVRLGRDVTLAELRRDFDAVFLGLGLQAVNALGIDTGGLEGVTDAVDYIARLRQTRDLGTLPVGRRIVVIGGGMTAIDIASQTKRLGAEDVTIVYRRGPEQMSASRFEQELAQTDGVLLRHWLRPRRLIGENGRLVAVELEYTKEEGGRLAGTGEILTLPCDQLFKAIGQAFVPTDLDGSGELLELEDGRIAVDAERRTSLERVWAGGDCVAGGRDLTVVAVEDGKRAALSIDRHLRAATSTQAA
ncbi:NAD(P)-dependent oxidoreductase [Benzoatithermus flavus]|uniref:dihydrouracil dehydrogenase (NAD(+)) n=1 Tax=Benzoatithermus flavus TaxID=3108223 RepID=A0ABU8XMJ7_9PROT